MQEEGLAKTEHTKIFVGQPSDITNQQLEEKIYKLGELVLDENIGLNNIKKTMAEVVPTYHEVEQKKTGLFENSKIKKALLNNANKSAFSNEDEEIKV